LLVISAAPPPDEPLMLVYHTLGTFHRGYWMEIATPYLAGQAGAAAGMGVLVYALGSTRFPSRLRAILLLAPVCIALASLSMSQGRTPQALAKKWDLTPEIRNAIPIPYEVERPRAATGIADGMIPGAALMREAKIPAPKRESAPILLFLRRGTANVRQLRYTEDGLPLDKNTEKPVLDFLESRRYHTALSWVALKHLYNLGTGNFDVTSAMQACMTSMDKAPHAYQIIQTLEMMLSTCAATPENLAILEELADPTRFSFPDRASARLMGDLYLRFGEATKALAWYRSAEMPKSFLHRVQTSKPMFRMGQISGIFKLNGKPLSGMRVGVHPIRLNGLPRRLEPVVLNSTQELFSPYFNPRFPLFPRFHPRPFLLRWIIAGATTDQNGAFKITHLTEGEYELVCTLPSNVELDPPFDNRLKIKNPPGACYVSYNTPNINTGVAEITAPLTAGAIQWEPAAGKKPKPESRAKNK
jgi:hypothetical protein